MKENNKTTGREWQKDDVKYAGAWRRWSARTVDIIWEGFVIGAFLNFINMSYIYYNYSKNLFFYILAVFLCLVIDSLCYWVFSNTPGKFLAGMALTDSNGNRVSAKDYCIHNLHVWWYGMFCGIPFIGVFSYIANFFLIVRDGCTYYDRKTFTEMRVVSKWGFIIFILPLFIVFSFIFGVFFYLLKK